MTALLARLKRLIAAGGPIPVSDYMALCLFDPVHGYYTNREPFGGKGDFTTAPEISQMFGEIVAAWLFAAWDASGRPANPVFAEIGPGRGTMMTDMLRTWMRLAPDFAGRIALIEASPRLTEIQKAALEAHPAKPLWVARIEDLPPGRLFLVGNELFDAIPVRQFVKTPDGWRERLVGFDDTDGLCFIAGPSGCDPAILPEGDAPDGAVFEYAPQREALMQTLCARLAATGGAALFFDYGHLKPGIGDTLQAVRAHAYDGIFDHPGEADLTSHVDFSALACIARQAGLRITTLTQGEFLLGVGIKERAQNLGAKATPEIRARLAGEAERLSGETGMGKLFKVLAIGAPQLALWPLGAA